MPTPRLTDPYKDLPILNAWLREADHKLRHISAGPGGVRIATLVNGGGGGTGSDTFWQQYDANTLTPIIGFEHVLLPGFISLAGTSINDSDAVGYIPVKVDFTLTNTVAGGIGPPIVGGNEVRGVNATVRNLRLAADEPTQGWDFIGIQGTAVIDSGTTFNIIGKQIGVRGEVYAQNLAAPKTHNFLFGMQTSVSQIGTNNTVTDAVGLVVSQPAQIGSGGTVTNLYGVWILNQAATSLTVTNPYAIKIDGVGQPGRIGWNGVEIQEIFSGTLGFRTTPGTGMEFTYASNTSSLLSYDRTGSAYKHLVLDGSDVTVNSSGTARVQVNSTGLVPSASATYDLGGSALRWNKTWAVQGNYSGVVDFLLGINVSGAGIDAHNQGILAGSINIGTTSPGTQLVDSSLNINGNSYSVNGTQIVNSSRSVGNVVDITMTGDLVLSTSTKHVDTGSGTTGGLYFGGAQYLRNSSGNLQGLTNVVLDSTHHFDTGNSTGGGYYVGGTQIVDENRNIGNVVAITCSGDIVQSGGHHIDASTGGYYLNATQWMDSSRNIFNMGTAMFGGSGSPTRTVDIQGSTTQMRLIGTSGGGSCALEMYTSGGTRNSVISAGSTVCLGVNDTSNTSMFTVDQTTGHTKVRVGDMNVVAGKYVCQAQNGTTASGVFTTFSFVGGICVSAT